MLKTFFLKKYDVIDLENIGIRDYAFDLISAIEFMYEAVEHRHRILGGDIVFFRNGKWELNYDNWYSEKTRPEETLVDALDYLRAYLEKTATQYPWKLTVTIDNGESQP